MTLPIPSGASSTQTLTVTITGTDQPAVVWIATTTPGGTAGGLWSTANNWETGTVPTATDDAIVITDQLRGLTPSYPVTIDQAAVAHTLTMNDFGTTPPVVINESALTVGSTITLAANSVLHNTSVGTINAGGPLEVQNTAVLKNYGTIVLADGGDFKDQSTISNVSGHDPILATNSDSSPRLRRSRPGRRDRYVCNCFSASLTSERSKSPAAS